MDILTNGNQLIVTLRSFFIEQCQGKPPWATSVLRFDGTWKSCLYTAQVSHHPASSSPSCVPIRRFLTLKQPHMSHRTWSDQLLGDIDINPGVEEYSRSPDINTFHAIALGSLERRRQIEKRLLWKLDLRLSFLILVSLMNYVGSPYFLIDPFSSFQIDRTNIAWVK